MKIISELIGRRFRGARLFDLYLIVDKYFPNSLNVYFYAHCVRFYVLCILQFANS